MADGMELEPQAPPLEQAPEQTPPQADPDEAAAVETPQGKMVPLAALKQLRGEHKALKEQAKHAQQLQEWVNTNKPKVDFMDQNQHLWQQPKPPAPPPDADPDLVEIAQSLDFYTTDGKPDLKRA